MTRRLFYIADKRFVAGFTYLCGAMALKLIAVRKAPVEVLCLADLNAALARRAARRLNDAAERAPVLRGASKLLGDNPSLHASDKLTPNRVVTAFPDGRAELAGLRC